jgi:hypothetical protein
MVILDSKLALSSIGTAGFPHPGVKINLDEIGMKA